MLIIYSKLNQEFTGQWLIIKYSSESDKSGTICGSDIFGIHPPTNKNLHLHHSFHFAETAGFEAVKIDARCNRFSGVVVAIPINGMNG